VTDPSPNPVPPPGWYRDPAEPGRQRWWDGSAWSNQVRWERTASSTTRSGHASSLSAGAAHPASHAGFRPVQHPATVASKPAVSVPTSVPASTALASFGRRFVATVIDNLLVSLVVTALMPLFVSGYQDRVVSGLKVWYAEVLAGGSGVMSADLSHLVVIMNYGLLAVTLVYGLVTLSAWSRTLGQRIMGIAVSPVDKPAEKLPLSRAVSRSLAWTLLSQGGGFFVILNAFSVSMALWHPKRQTLPDLLARTQVVRRG
jgi:uncharacterized RDD family membrane protein YckC